MKLLKSVLAFTLLLSLAACSGNSSSGSSDLETPDETTATESATPESTEESAEENNDGSVVEIINAMQQFTGEDYTGDLYYIGYLKLLRGTLHPGDSLETFYVQINEQLNVYLNYTYVFHLDELRLYDGYDSSIFNYGEQNPFTDNLGTDITEVSFDENEETYVWFKFNYYEYNDESTAALYESQGNLAVTPGTMNRVTKFKATATNIDSTQEFSVNNTSLPLYIAMTPALGSYEACLTSSCSITTYIPTYIDTLVETVEGDDLELSPGESQEFTITLDVGIYLEDNYDQTISQVLMYYAPYNANIELTNIEVIE